MLEKTSNDNKALKIAKIISYNFLTVLISKDSLSRLGDFYPTIESRKLAREWFALQVLLMVISISNYYKEAPIGLNIAKHFHGYIVEGLAEAGVYGSSDEATEFIKSRLDFYNERMSIKKDNPLMNMSIQFLKYINNEDALLLVNTGEQISVILQTNIKLIREAKKIANEKV